MVQSHIHLPVSKPLEVSGRLLLSRHVQDCIVKGLTWQKPY